MEHSKEIDWLINHELPRILSYVQKTLLSCLKGAFEKPTNPYKIFCTSSTSGTDAVGGCAMIHFDTICSMEILIKATKSQPAIKASFRSDKQWKLQQIQDAYNSMREAGRLLRMIQDEKPGLESLVYFIDHLIVQLRRCQNRLISPSLLSLSGLVNSALSKMFVPPLPGDTLINIFVLEDHLVIVLYTVQQAHSNASLNSSKGGKLHLRSDNKLLFHPVGSIIDYAGSQYEVASTNRSEIHLSAISNLLQVASSTQMIFQSFLEKLNRLNGNTKSVVS